MLKTDKYIQDLIFILNNLRKEDKQELQALWGLSWKQSAIENIKNANYMILTGNNGDGTEVPIAVGGFEEVFIKDREIACVWLLTTKYIKYNKILLFKTIMCQLNKASNKYKVLYNCIYNANFGAKKWLKKLGFCFDNPHPKNLVIPINFEFFYKLSV